MQWFYILPLVIITVFMLYGFSPAYSAILGLVTCIVISWVRKDTRIGPKRFVEAAREGTETVSRSVPQWGHRHHHRVLTFSG